MNDVLPTESKNFFGSHKHPFFAFSYLFYSSIVVFSLLFLGCQPKKPTVKIGLNTELTGEVPAVGASCVHAAKLFVSEVNKAGGIDVGGTNIPLSLAIGDNISKPDQAAAVTQRLISQKGVLVMIGPNTSSCSVPAAEIAESLGCLMISPWSTNLGTTRNSITGAFKKNVFRACFTQASEAPALANFAFHDLHASKAAILYDMSSESPNSVAHQFQKAFTKDGGSVIAMQTYTTGDRDFSAQLTKIKDSEPDLIFLPAYYNDVPLIGEQARRLGIKAPFLGYNAWSTPEIITLDTQHYLEGSCFSNHFSTQSTLPTAKKFITAYQKKYGQLPDDIAALTYDSMALAAAAITQAGVLNRTAVCNAMASLGKFNGVTGSFNYKEGSHDPMKDIVMLTIKNGAFNAIATLHP